MCLYIELVGYFMKFGYFLEFGLLYTFLYQDDISRVLGRSSSRVCMFYLI